MLPQAASCTRCLQLCIKDVFVCLGQHGHFLWVQGSPGEGLHSPGEGLRGSVVVGCACCVTMSGSAAVRVPHLPDVRLPLPGVVLLRERDQRHPVRLQALHPGGGAQDLLRPPRGALVRSKHRRFTWRAPAARDAPQTGRSHSPPPPAR